MHVDYPAIYFLLYALYKQKHHNEYLIPGICFIILLGGKLRISIFAINWLENILVTFTEPVQDFLRLSQIQELFPNFRFIASRFHVLILQHVKVKIGKVT